MSWKVVWTRTSVYFAPSPCYFVSGEGSRVTDLDGNTRIDFLNNYTSLLNGHAYPPMVEAVQKQMRKGTAFAAPNELEVWLVRIIKDRLPSMERLRFTSGDVRSARRSGVYKPEKDSQVRGWISRLLRPITGQRWSIIG